PCYSKKPCSTATGKPSWSMAPTQPALIETNSSSPVSGTGSVSAGGSVGSSAGGSVGSSSSGIALGSSIGASVGALTGSVGVGCPGDAQAVSTKARINIRLVSHRKLSFFMIFSSSYLEPKESPNRQGLFYCSCFPPFYPDHHSNRLS